MNNDKILKQLQESYPNLRDFIVNDGLLSYNGYNLNVDLSQIDPIFFNLLPDSIFAYLKNGIYKSWDINKRIIHHLNNLVVTEEEIKELNFFVIQLMIKRDIIKNNIDFFNKSINNPSIRKFYKEYLDSDEILKKAISNRGSSYPANAMLANMIDEQRKNEVQNNTNTQDLGYSRVRGKKDIKGYDVFKENEEYLEKLNKRQNLNAAGFTSIILIVSTILAVASYLALNLLK